MTGYPRAMSEHGPARSLEAVQLQLRRERTALLLEQLEHETAGCDTAAEHCQRRIEDIEKRLRAIESARR